MNIIVTGAAGFIGSHVAEIMVQHGHDVLAIDDLSGGSVSNIPFGSQFVQQSITDPLDHIFERHRPKAVFHLAAYAAEGLSHHIPVFNFRNNVVGTANVLAAAYRCGTEHFVFTSSIAAYGHPTNHAPFTEEGECHPCDPYGIAKLASEQHVRAFFEYYGRPTFTIFRPHNVFGPRQNISDPYRNVVGIFMAHALRKKPLPIFGDGSQTRSFSYISTVAQCIAAAPCVPAARNRTINVGGDEPMSVLELARRISKLMSAPEMIEWLPPRKEVHDAHCGHDLARALFPKFYENSIGIQEGLELMAEFVRNRPIQPPTPCPAPIEVFDSLPPSWNRTVNPTGAARST